jgi:hypothetical protein
MRVHLSRLGSRRAPEPEGGDKAAPAARSHRRVAAREAEPARMRAAHRRRCETRVQEPRPPCTTTGLWQATLRSGERRKGLRLSRRAGLVRTEIAAWDARELASYLYQVPEGVTRLGLVGLERV